VAGLNELPDQVKATPPLRLGAPAVWLILQHAFVLLGAWACGRTGMARPAGPTQSVGLCGIELSAVYVGGAGRFHRRAPDQALDACTRRNRRGPVPAGGRVETQEQAGR
jgi:hypothetical protein